jgi:single-stranded-DNA-specific exonuclease
MLPVVPRWSCEPYAATSSLALADALGVTPWTATVLTRRGLGDTESARAFLAGGDRHDPCLLGDMDAACELILRHVRDRSRIAVFGDYDVDGVCATAIAVRALRALGVEPPWRLPSRDEGYGLSEAAVRELAARGAGLIVTVDCGVTAAAEVELAQSLGVDVVVTDHHRAGAVLPDCPIVHPARGGYPFDGLCGAAVALKLSEALRVAAGHDPAAAEDDLDLAGLATVCDMVPLVDESRRIARGGLAALARTRKPGLRALMRVAALDPGDVDERAAGFRLGPRLNAAGRLGRADAALELLLTEDDGRADEVARELDGLNHDRREAELRIVREAEALCAPQLAAAAIVVAGEGWHPGVVGIVASRLVERHRRPCVAIALDSERGRGSGRSIGAYDLHAGLGAAGEHLLRFGGHAMAAGLEIEAGRVDGFRAALAADAGAALTPGDLVPVQDAHAVVPAGALTLELAEELERLGPFGAGNPAPVLVVPAARIEHVTAMGQEREHARFTLAGGSARARGVAFRTSQRALADAGAAEHDVAVALERNRWNGTVEARVVLRSLCSTREGHVVDVEVEERSLEGGSSPDGEAPAVAGRVCDPALVAVVERELAADPAAWWPSPPGAAVRELRDRGEGFAGVAGDLLTSGERVLVVVADVARRRAGLERLVAGMAAGPLPVVSWGALASQPALTAGFEHLVVLDPPPVAEGLAVLAGAPAPAGGGIAHLAWGEPERAFALACWRERLELRPALSELWRALGAAGTLEGSELDAALRGAGLHPRDGAHCGRLVRVLCELDLAVWEPAGTAGARLLRGPGGRTDLARSPAQRAYAARLADAERHLSGAVREEARAAG